MMDLLCLIGTAIGACAAFWPSYGNKIAFIVMWVMYQSLYQVGETFLWFQWDILLLEVSVYDEKNIIFDSFPLEYFSSLFS